MNHYHTVTRDSPEHLERVSVTYYSEREARRSIARRLLARHGLDFYWRIVKNGETIEEHEARS